MENKIYIQDFRSLEEELLKIDYLRFYLNQYLSTDQIKALALYFESLGFSCYVKDRDTSRHRTQLFVSDKKQEFELTFIKETTYQKSTHLEFAGESGNHLYYLIKTEKVNWELLQDYGASLKRIDTCYDHPTILKSDQKVSNNKFIDATIKQFRKSFPKKNITYRNNQKGELATVGYRGSGGKFYRVYEKENGVRFEFEYTHPENLNFYQELLKTKEFQLFEKHISFQFFNQSYFLFKNSQEPEWVVWMAKRLRPLQIRNHLDSFDTTINIDYITQSEIGHPHKVNMVILFQLFAYLRSLDNNYQIGNLTSKFRKYNFPVTDFVKFSKNQKTVNHSQVIKAKDFFNKILKENLVLQFFSSKSYRMLVTIPEANAKLIRNRWMAEVWVADELFDYLEPFLFCDDFKKITLNSYEFSVLFQIIQNYSVDNLRKEFDISKFIESHPSKPNGTRKKKIKEFFLYYIKKLYQDKKIQQQIVFPLLSEENPNREIKIFDLNSEHLNQPFIIFELLEVNFVKPEIRDL